MRCQSCNKFVSQEPGDPDTSIEIIGGDTVRIECRLPINCSECCDELKEGNFEMEVDIPTEIVEAHCGEGHELDAEEESTEAIDEMETTDRKGKPIKSFRYMKHLYGVDCSFNVTCSCQEEPVFSSSADEKMPSSSFDELQ
jgi:hypothetical protein